jgi:hypothetical protein
MTIKVPSTILSFAKDTNPYTMFVEYYRHWQEVSDAKVKREYPRVDSKGNIISFSQREDVMNKVLLAEVERISQVHYDPAIDLRQWAMHPNVKWAAGAIISALVDMVLPDSLIDSIGLYSDVINGSYGQSFKFDIKARDLFVVSKSGHSQKSTEVHRQFATTVTAVPEPHQITVGVDLYRVLAGIDSLAELTSKAIMSIEASMAADAYNVFATAMGNLSVVGAATYSYMKVVGYTQDSMISLAQRVQAWNGGAKPVLAGTARALRYILPDDGNYRYDLESDYFKVGYVRTASGFDTFVLEQFADWSTPFSVLLNDSNVYVLSPSGQQTYSRFVLKGQPSPILPPHLIILI